jgi:hypothetical protein
MPIPHRLRRHILLDHTLMVLYIQDRFLCLAIRYHHIAPARLALIHMTPAAHPLLTLMMRTVLVMTLGDISRLGNILRLWHA